MWWNDKVDDGVGLKDLFTHESWDVHMLTTRGSQALLVRWPWVGSIKKWNVGVVWTLNWTTTFDSFINRKGFWSIHTQLTSQVVSNALYIGILVSFILQQFKTSHGLVTHVNKILNVQNWNIYIINGKDSLV
jgi:hypothetical protein